MSKEKTKSKKFEGISKKVRILMKLRKYQLKEKKVEENLTDLFASRSKTGEKVWMRHIVKSKLKSGRTGVKQVRRMNKMLEDMDIDKPMLIGSGFTYAARKEARKNRIELVSTETLPSFDIFKHELVPKHEILSKEEVEELLKKYRIAPYQIPRIKASDPAAKMIGAKPGDIMRVIRKSHTAGRSIAYRYVV
jgi:DNA-directed RNA polymerase subunit H